MKEQRSYYALRRQGTNEQADWWRAASARADLPAALAPLAAGRSRVELDRRAAADALDWIDTATEEDVDTSRLVVAYPDDPRD